VKEVVFFPIYAFATFVKNQMAGPTWPYFWIFCYIGFMCLFLCQYQAVFVTMAGVI
jgi:hypothetical protein